MPSSGPGSTRSMRPRTRWSPTSISNRPRTAGAAGDLGLAAVPQLKHAHAVAPVLVGDGPGREPAGVEPLAVGGLQVLGVVPDVALGGELEDGVHEPAERHLVGGAVEPGDAAEEVLEVAVLVGPDPG